MAVAGMRADLPPLTPKLIQQLSRNAFITEYTETTEKMRMKGDLQVFLCALCG